MTKLSLPTNTVLNNPEVDKEPSTIKSLLSALLKDYPILMVIFILGFVVRMVLVAYVAPYPERFIQTDAVGYNQLAVNLVSGHGFSQKEAPPYLPDNFRTPLYPFLLALHFSIFGYRPDLFLYFQAFIGSLTIIVVYTIGRTLGNNKTGLLAAGFFALSLHTITYTAMLWSDTLYTFLLTGAIGLTILMFKNRAEMKYVYFSGLALGIATLAHPRSLYLPLLIAAILCLVYLRDRVPLKQILVHAGVYLLIFNLVLAPWMVRNYSVFDVPNLTSAQGINMYFYGAALMEASETGEEHWVVVDRYEIELMKEGAYALNEARKAQLAFDLAIKKISENPIPYLRAHLIGTLKVFLPTIFTLSFLITGQDHEYRESPFSFLILTPFSVDSINDTTARSPLFIWTLFLFTIIHLSIIYALSIFTLIKKWKPVWSWMLVSIILYLAVVAGPAGTPRFQLPIIPLVSVVATFPFVYLTLRK
jgi:4-amino-4-deoxy-L-arabinose transferase-like glycosyltransferase